MTPADKYAVAIHEAGHAVACHRLGYPFYYATIKPRYGGGGTGF